MPKLKFGCILPMRGPCATIDNLAMTARESEALGFDAVYLNDHIMSEWHKHQNDFQGIVPPEVPQNLADPIVFESITTMTYLAAITERVEINVSVMLLPIRDPILLAKQVATLDTFSNGRIVLGVGVGNIMDLPEFRNLNFRFPFEERGKVADEYIRAMKAIWTEPEPTFEGKYVKFNKILIYPKPYRKPHPPIIVGGRSPPAERRAAQLGDGYNPSFSGLPEYGEEIERIRALGKRYGRDMTNFRFIAQTFTNIDESREAAQKAIEYQLVIRGGGLYGGAHAKEVIDMTKSADWTSRGYVERALVGRPTDIIQKIEKTTAIQGITDLQIFFVHPTIESYMKQLRMFAKEVLPSFK